MGESTFTVYFLFHTRGEGRCGSERVGVGQRGSVLVSDVKDKAVRVTDLLCSSL